MESKHILAIEIGSSKVKGAVGVIDPDGILSVVAIEEERVAEAVRHGLIINVETVASRVLSVIRKLENRVSPRKGRSIYLSIGGRSFRSSLREIERQLPTEEQITQSLITQLREDALATALSDREVVAVVDGAYYVDHHQNQYPVGTYGRNISASFNLITCRLQALRNLRRVFGERLNLKINDSFVRQLAVAELVLSSDQRRQGCMLVDFGAETTTVSIYKFGALRYMETLPMGSRNITRDICRLNYLEEKAEELKIVGGNALAPTHMSQQQKDGIDFTDINYYVNARATEIAANINQQIVYAGLTVTDLPGGVVMVGGGAKLRGFNDLLEKFIKLKVYAGMPSATVHIADSRIPAYDSIDVIATLYAASKLPNPQECMADPTPRPNPQPEVPRPEPMPEPEPDPEPDPEIIGSDIIDKTDEPDPYITGGKTRRRFLNFGKIARSIEKMLSDPEADEDDEDYKDDED